MHTIKKLTLLALCQFFCLISNKSWAETPEYTSGPEACSPQAMYDDGAFHKKSSYLINNTKFAILPEDITVGHYVQRVAIKGPVNIKLCDQAILNVSAENAFLLDKSAFVMMTDYANNVSPNLIGMLLFFEENGFVVIKFHPTGYINQNPLLKWDVNKFLDRLRENTARNNQERRSQGYKELQIMDWRDHPVYDVNKNRLSWSILMKVDSIFQRKPQIANYSTLLIGKDGYFSFTLVTAPHDMANLKPKFEKIIDGFSFNSGKEYSSFVSGDRLAPDNLSSLLVDGMGVNN